MTDLAAALDDVRRLMTVDASKAEAAARDILREHPEEPDALLLLAVALRRKGAANSARAVLDILTETQSHRPQLHYELGLVLGMLGVAGRPNWAPRQRAGWASRAARLLIPGNVTERTFCSQRL